MAGKVKWKYKLQGARSVTQRRPVTGGDVVVATFNYGSGATFRGSLVALDAETGQQLWRFDTHHYLNVPQVSTDGFIYVTCFDGSAQKLALDGTVQWRQEVTGCNVWNGILLADMFVVPEIHGGARFIHAISRANGETVWSYECNGPAGLSSNGDNRLAAVIREGSVCQLTCIDALLGRELWKKPAGQLGQPLVDSDKVYVGRGACIQVYDLETGTIKAERVVANEIGFSPELSTDEGVIFASQSGTMFCMDAKLEERWRVETPGVVGNVLETAETVLAMTAVGQLIEISKRNGEQATARQVPGFKTGYGIARLAQDIIVAASAECVRM